MHITLSEKRRSPRSNNGDYYLQLTLDWEPVNDPQIFKFIYQTERPGNSGWVRHYNSSESMLKLVSAIVVFKLIMIHGEPGNNLVNSRYYPLQ